MLFITIGFAVLFFVGGVLVKEKKELVTNLEEGKVSEYTHYAAADGTSLLLLSIIGLFKKMPIKVVKFILMIFSLFFFLLSYLIYIGA